MIDLFKKLAISASLLAASAAATAQTVGYELISPPQNTSTDEQVEVIEHFWLGCPHCYSFEPTIEAWKEQKPDYVKFVREAPPLNGAWEQHSRAFYAARMLGHEDAFVEAMFKALHEDKQRLRRPKEIAQVAAQVGMDEKKFLKAMQSFAVNTAIQRAMQQATGAGISGVPAIVINGKYRTGASIAGSNALMIEVIDRMAAIEAKSMGIDTAATAVPAEAGDETAANDANSADTMTADTAASD